MDKKISNMTFGGIELKILGLYLSDYTAKFHVREISRILDANHRTISLALKALENKGVMKHEIAGKNKQYFLNLDNFLTKEYIRNAESAKKIKLLDKYFVIKKLLAELSEDLKGTPMILFGSYSKGEETKDSDVDILILKDGKEQKIENIIKEFAKRHNIEIQLQKMTGNQFESGIRKRDNLIVEIVNNHIILNGSEFFVDMLWRYFHER